MVRQWTPKYEWVQVGNNDKNKNHYNASIVHLVHLT